MVTPNLIVSWSKDQYKKIWWKSLKYNFSYNGLEDRGSGSRVKKYYVEVKTKMEKLL